MVLTAASVPRKADVVADDLLRRIVSGEHAVGSLLPKESELAAHYGVNRSVVREAIKLLEVHRLVRPVRRLGTVVLNPLESLSPAVLQAMLAPGPGSIDRALLKNLLEIRAALDLQMTTMAAERRTESDVAELERRLEEVKRAVEEGGREQVQARVDELTRAVARATQNRIFEMLVSWHQHVARALDDIFRTVRPVNQPYVRGLELLVGLIRDQDTEQARLLVQAFHEWATPRLMAAAALHTGEPLDDLLLEDAR